MAQEKHTTAQESAGNKKGGFWGNMSTLQKFLLFVFAMIIFFLIWTFFFGGISNIYQFAFFLICFVASFILFIILLTFVVNWMQPDQFSPKKDYFNRIVNLAVDLRPDNVQDLYFRGDKDKKRVKAGHIKGVLGIPYLVGHVKRYEDDEIDTKNPKITHHKGEPVYAYSNRLKKNIPVFEAFEYSTDGDTFFIYEAGWFLFKKKHYLRCHRSLHGDLNGDVEIYDINPVPYGSLYEYPFKQLQADPAQIMIQNQLEVILATVEHHYDLISQGVDSAVYFNPYFRLIAKQKAEMPAPNE